MTCPCCPLPREIESYLRAELAKALPLLIDGEDE